jgi:glycosyltransferase involved in cell wall biosynthesis
MTRPDTKTILIVTCQRLHHPIFPSTGGSLRAYMLGEAFKSKGYKVLYSQPKSCLNTSVPLSGERKELSHSADNMGEVIHRCEPDVVLFSNWGLAARTPSLDVPVIVDVNGSLVLENYYRRHTVLLDDALTKIRALEKADLVVTGSFRQKQYLIAWGLMAGMNPDALPIEVVPFSLSPHLPTPKIPENPVAVIAGYAWPWLDGHHMLKVATDQMEALNTGRLLIYSSSPPYNDTLLDEDSSSDKTGDSARRPFPRTHYSDPVSFEQLTATLSRCSFAMDVWKDNPERELAFPSRTVAYLWAGLPVITSVKGDLAQLISSYQSGWVVDHDDTQRLSALVRSLLKDPQMAAEHGANAQKLVREHLSWDKTIEPLARFCRDPEKRYGRSPLLAKIGTLQNDGIDLNHKITALYETISDYKGKAAALDKERKLLGEVHRRAKGFAVLISPKHMRLIIRRWMFAWPLLFYLMAITAVGHRLHVLLIWWRQRRR